MSKKNKVNSIRILAGMFDFLIILFLSLIILLWPIVLISGEISSSGSVSNNNLILSICLLCLSLVITFLYLLLPLIGFKGSTLGMQVFKIRFANADESNIKFVQALGIAGLKVVLNLFTLGIFLIVDTIMIYSKKHTTVVDKIMKVHAINKVSEEELQ